MRVGLKQDIGFHLAKTFDGSTKNTVKIWHSYIINSPSDHTHENLCNQLAFLQNSGLAVLAQALILMMILKTVCFFLLDFLSHLLHLSLFQVYHKSMIYN